MGTYNGAKSHSVSLGGSAGVKDMGTTRKSLPTIGGKKAQTARPDGSAAEMGAAVKGGYIAPLRATHSSRMHAEVSLVHTTGGITNVNSTCLHTPGPGQYHIPAPPPKRKCTLPRASRKIHSHCGPIDLFASWNGLVCTVLLE